MRFAESTSASNSPRLQESVYSLVLVKFIGFVISLTLLALATGLELLVAEDNAAMLSKDVSDATFCNR